MLGKYKNLSTRQNPFEGVKVGSRILAGLTAFFECENEAKDHAHQTRSYHYPCFGNLVNDEDDAPLRLVGYCVPK